MHRATAEEQHHPPSPGRANVAQFFDIIVESGESMAFTPARNPRVIKLPGSRTPNKPRGCMAQSVFSLCLFSFARLVLHSQALASWTVA